MNKLIKEIVRTYLWNKSYRLVVLLFLICNLYNVLTTLYIGFCSNGEYNAMMNQGYTIPLSVLKIRSNMRSKYANV